MADMDVAATATVAAMPTDGAEDTVAPDTAMRAVAMQAADTQAAVEADIAAALALR
jgi:hypothetical protein